MTRWVVANAMGEAGAMALSSLLGALFSSVVPADGAGLLLLPMFMVLVGTLEGALVGAAQAAVLDVPRGPWILRTAGAFGCAWALGALASFLESSAEPSMGTVLLFAGGAGLVLGGLVGAAQWSLVKHSAHVWRCALGWGCAMITLAIFADLVPDGPLKATSLAAEISGGAIAGALMAVVTSDSVVALGAKQKK